MNKWEHGDMAQRLSFEGSVGMPDEPMCLRCLKGKAGMMKRAMNI